MHMTLLYMYTKVLASHSNSAQGQVRLSAVGDARGSDAFSLSIDSCSAAFMNERTSL